MSRLRPGAAGAREAGAARRARSLKYVAAVAIVAAALAAFVALRPWGRGAPRDESAVRKGPAGAGGPAEHRRQRIVVLPFENLGAPDDAYFAAGWEELVSDVAGIYNRLTPEERERTGIFANNYKARATAWSASAPRSRKAPSTRTPGAWRRRTARSTSAAVRRPRSRSCGPA